VGVERFTIDLGSYGVSCHLGLHACAGGCLAGARNT
jgi:hypothetical protein